MQLEGGNHQLAQPLELADPGQQIKKVGRVLAPFGPAREQPEVTIKPGSDRIVVARGQVRVAADMVPFAPDRNYVNVAAGVTATLPRGVSGFVHYETVLGRDRVTTHSFTAGLRFQFD